MSTYCNYWNKVSLVKSKIKQSKKIDSIGIGLASPEEIRRWGERRLPNGTLIGKVDKDHTVDYESLKPIEGGLFCERIFGPVEDFYCSCERKGEKNEKFCPNCEVEFTKSRVRRIRMGYIPLAVPVVHVWYLRGRPSYIANLVGKSRNSIDRLAYGETLCESFIGSSSLKSIYKKKENFFQDDELFRVLRPLQSKGRLCYEWTQNDASFSNSISPMLNNEFSVHPFSAVRSSLRTQRSSFQRSKERKTRNLAKLYPEGVRRNLPNPYFPIPSTTLQPASLGYWASKPSTSNRRFLPLASDLKRSCLSETLELAEVKNKKLQSNYAFYEKNSVNKLIKGVFSHTVVASTGSMRNIYRSAEGTPRFSSLFTVPMQKVIRNTGSVKETYFNKPVVISNIAKSNKVSLLGQKGFSTLLSETSKDSKEFISVKQSKEGIVFYSIPASKPLRFQLRKQRSVGGVALQSWLRGTGLLCWVRSEINVCKESRADSVKAENLEPQLRKPLRDIASLSQLHTPSGYGKQGIRYASFASPLLAVPQRGMSWTLFNVSSSLGSKDGVEFAKQLVAPRPKEKRLNFSTHNRQKEVSPVMQVAKLLPQRGTVQSKEGASFSASQSVAERGIKIVGQKQKYLKFHTLPLFSTFVYKEWSHRFSFLEYFIWSARNNDLVLPFYTYQISRVEKSRASICESIRKSSINLIRNKFSLRFSKKNNLSLNVASLLNYSNKIMGFPCSSKMKFISRFRRNLGMDALLPFLGTQSTDSRQEETHVPLAFGEQEAQVRLLFNSKQDLNSSNCSVFDSSASFTSKALKGYAEQSSALQLAKLNFSAFLRTQSKEVQQKRDTELAKLGIKALKELAKHTQYPYPEGVVRGFASQALQRVASKGVKGSKHYKIIQNCSALLLRSPSKAKEFISAEQDVELQEARGCVKLGISLRPRGAQVASEQSSLRAFIGFSRLCEARRNSRFRRNLLKDAKQKERSFASFAKHGKKWTQRTKSKAELFCIPSDAKERIHFSGAKEIFSAFSTIEQDTESTPLNKMDTQQFPRLTELLSFTGGAALRNLLSRFDLIILSKFLRHELKNLELKVNNLLALKMLTYSQGLLLGKLAKRRSKQIRRLKLLELFQSQKSNPEWMILSVIPVLPPDLRPILRVNDDFVVASDLNRLYQTVLRRNNTIHERLDDPLPCPESGLFRQRSLQKAVDGLLENGKGGGTPLCASKRRPLVSLSHVLKGKKGLFRQHLLGKRVDYSGRSVIVVGPRLQLHECGLPKEMAIELFQPFLLHRLKVKGLATSNTTARRMIQQEDPVIWHILKQLVYEHPVLLNRAPTLHRLGIQAFQPRLVSGRAILLHPLVCNGFNADFDGDQMAVHVPLSFQARAEAWKIMWSKNNFLSPATGQPILVPSQDMVLGCYYLSVSIPRILDANVVVERQNSVMSPTHCFESEGKEQNATNREISASFSRLCEARRNPSDARQALLKQSTFLNKNKGHYFSNLQDSLLAYFQGRVQTHTPFWVRMDPISFNEPLISPLATQRTLYQPALQGKSFADLDSKKVEGVYAQDQEGLLLSALNSKTSEKDSWYEQSSTKMNSLGSKAVPLRGNESSKGEGLGSWVPKLKLPDLQGNPSFALRPLQSKECVLRKDNREGVQRNSVSLARRKSSVLQPLRIALHKKQRACVVEKGSKARDNAAVPLRGKEEGLQRNQELNKATNHNVQLVNKPNIDALKALKLPFLQPLYGSSREMCKILFQNKSINHFQIRVEANETLESPLELRLSIAGNLANILTMFQNHYNYNATWVKQCKEESIKYMRTTAGRVVINKAVFKNF